MVIEVKLGKNGELSEAVAEQLEHYVRHIRDEAPQAYARCYEKTYAQKRRLGLIAGDDMPGEIEIDGSEVEGLVVVEGYTQEAKAQAERLKVGHPELSVHIFQNSLVGEGGGVGRRLAAPFEVSWGRRGASHPRTERHGDARRA